MSREDRLKSIRSKIENGEYLTQKKIDQVADEIQRELCGCSSRRERDTGLAAGISILVFLGLLVAVIVLKTCGL